ncbi:hypothetical protein [Streptomyces cellostaticus]|uniref:hypothetical protein n=1 Tax=Streptomyces cellostaticus TaxID=67285 RepID=UPI0020270453|nr:hypothetical protein [Streptomyces cellostaticus]
MGVFSRLLGSSKAKREAPAAEGPGGGAPEQVAAPEQVEGTETAGPTGATEGGRVGATAGADASEDRVTEDAGTAEGAEIPKQQSADEAADSEAGEGARR